MGGDQAQEDQDAEEEAKLQRRQEHQIIVTTLCNKVVLIHANPFLGKIFIYSLDPAGEVKYPRQISYPVSALVRLQLLDGILVVHNLDEKASQMYDLRLSEFNQPLLGPCLFEVDSQYAAQQAYFSDLFLPEE